MFIIATGTASVTLSEPETESYIASIKARRTNFRNKRKRDKTRNFAFTSETTGLLIAKPQTIIARPQDYLQANHRYEYKA